MSTRCDREKRALQRGLSPRDPADQVALVAQAQRERLLGIHRHRLSREDLEDCYSQAMLELVLRARRSGFSSSEHVAHALEQRFLSRVLDRRRAVSGRSPREAMHESALAGGGLVEDLEDGRLGIEELVMLRMELGRLQVLMRQLTRDQQLVLVAQAYLSMECSDFCQRFGWSPEKYRKVAQRARARLRILSRDPEIDVPLSDPCRSGQQSQP